MVMMKKLILYKSGKKIEVPIKRASNDKLFSLVPIDNNSLFNRTSSWQTTFSLREYDNHGYIIVDTSKKKKTYISGTGMYVEGSIVYGGEGKFNSNCPEKSRMLHHPGSRLDKEWEKNKETWVAVAVGWGMLKEEAEAWEALFLHENAHLLTKRGTEWIEGNLINIMPEKRNYELKTKKLIKEEIWKSL